MNTRTPAQGKSAPLVSDARAATSTAEGLGVQPNLSANRVKADRLTPADVMMLQRSVGNQVVQRLLQRGGNPTPPPTSASPAPQPPSPAITHTAPPNLIQAKIDIAGVEQAQEADPVTKWHLNPDEVNLYHEISSSKESVYFKDEGDMLSYLKHYAQWFAKQPGNYRAQATGPNVEPITAATASAATRAGGEVRSTINVDLLSGAKETVNVFSSEKRHLLDTFTQDKGKPPDSKENNSLVLDVNAFVAGFKDYADEQAKALKAHVMLQGYKPDTVKHTSTTARFITDQAEIPNETYERHNAIHSFPASGTAVVTPSQEIYAKIVTLASHLYQTDDFTRARKTDKARKTKSRTELIEAWKRNIDHEVQIKHHETGVVLKTIKPNKEFLDAAERNRQYLATNLPIFIAKGLNVVDTPQVIAGKYEALEGKDKGAIYSNIVGVIGTMASLASTYGTISEVEPGADLTVPVGQAAALYQELQGNPDGKLVTDTLIKLSPPKADLLEAVKTTTPNTSVTRESKYKNAKEAQVAQHSVTKTTPLLDKVRMLQKLYKSLVDNGLDYKTLM